MSNFELGLECVNNEVALVGQLQVGSEEAYEVLISLYQEPVYGLAYRILGNHAEAAERPKRPFSNIQRDRKVSRRMRAKDLGL